MAETRWDAVVVGAGPAGASAARTLTEGGLKTLIVEKKRMPRQKMCSGILSDWTLDFVHRMFGPIPPDVYGSPAFITGVSLHFPSLPDPASIPTRSPVPNVWRGTFDRFLARASGAKIRDRLKMVSLREVPDGYLVGCEDTRKGGGRKPVAFRARYLVAADGANSRAIRQLMPGAFAGVPYGSGMQVLYRGEADLDPRHYHVFFHTGLGFYAWASVKDEAIHVGVGGLGRVKLPPVHARFVSLLQDRHGLRIREVALREGMTGVIRGPLNRFVLGRGNFLATGDAAGFVHNMGEGISCALTTGHRAGQAVLEAEQTGGTAHDVYRRIVRPEVELCLDQFNPLRMFFKLPIRMDNLALWRNHSLGQLKLMGHDLKAFARQDVGFRQIGLGRNMKRNTLHRLRHGSYPVEL